jgi:hypothetical protein
MRFGKASSASIMHHDKMVSVDAAQLIIKATARVQYDNLGSKLLKSHQISHAKAHFWMFLPSRRSLSLM